MQRALQVSVRGDQEPEKRKKGSNARGGLAECMLFWPVTLASSRNLSNVSSPAGGLIAKTKPAAHSFTGTSWPE